MRHAARDTERAPSRRLKVGVGAATVLLIAAFVVAALVSGASGGRSVSLPSATPSSSSGPTATSGPPDELGLADELYVHVTGAVKQPGLVRVAPGSRVVDAVEAAGGLADGADPAGVNLARRVQDGEALRVPLVGESAVAAAPGESAVAGGGAAPGGLVDLNTASADQLETLPRIGPALAQRIVDWREANGRFAAVTDLMNVTGVGQKIFDGLKDRVTV